MIDTIEKILQGLLLFLLILLALVFLKDLIFGEIRKVKEIELIPPNTCKVHLFKKGVFIYYKIYKKDCVLRGDMNPFVEGKDFLEFKLFDIYGKEFKEGD